MRPPSQQHICDPILIYLNILIQPINLVMVRINLIEDLCLNLLAYAFGLGSVLLQIGFSWVASCFLEGVELVDSCD